MKRVFSFISLASFILVACGKEEVINENEPINERPQSGTVTLTAVMPSFVSDTKAGVASDGTFSWTVGDLIDVVYTDGESEKRIKFSCSSINNESGDDYGEGTFVNVVEEGNDIPDGYSIKTAGNIAFYPTGYNGTPSNQTFSSIEDAAKGFQMHATYDNGKIQFAHDNAILMLTITNLPYFAKQIVAGGATVNVSNTTDQASETIYLPVVAAAAAKLSIAVKDKTSEGNDIITKTTKHSVAIVKGHIYTGIKALPIGRYVAFENSSNSTHRIGLMGKTVAGAESVGWKEFVLQSNGTTKYIMLEGLDKDRDYLSAPVLQIELRQNDGGDYYVKSSTPYVINDRNFKFDVSENSMKTEYRVYLKSSTRTSFYLYITKPLTINVTNTAGWGTYEVKQADNSYTTWSGNKAWGNASFDINADLVGTTTGKLSIGYFGNDDNWSFDCDFTGDYAVDFKGSSTSTPTASYTKRISDSWPGDNKTGISSTPNVYVSFDNTYYGQYVWLMFSDNGSNRSLQTPCINQDNIYAY